MKGEQWQVATVTSGHESVAWSLLKLCWTSQEVRVHEQLTHIGILQYNLHLLHQQLTGLLLRPQF